MIKALIGGAVVFLIATFPATWLLMLFIGNATLIELFGGPEGVGLSYWGTLPLGILVSAVIGGVSARSMP